jgi:uncharacterized protein YchJ
MRKTKTKYALTEKQERRAVELMRKGFSAYVVKEKYFPQVSVMALYRARKRLDKEPDR